VHLRLAAEPFDALTKSAPVDPDGLAQGFVAIENGAKFEGEDCGIAEGVTDDSGVLDGGFLVQSARRGLIFANHHGKFAAGIAQNRSTIHTLNTF